MMCVIAHVIIVTFSHVFIPARSILERYSHEGYLIKVVVLAVAGRSLDMVEPNPIHGLIKNITI